MWTKYFKVIKVRPGRIRTSSHGELDFSRNDISVEICKELFESDFPYLEITDEGRKELYGIVPITDLVVETAPENGHSETVEPKDPPPNRRKYAKKKGSE